MLSTCLDLFLYSADMRTYVILVSLLRVTNVIRRDLPVVVDDGRSFLGTLPDSVYVTAAA